MPLRRDLQICLARGRWLREAIRMSLSPLLVPGWMGHRDRQTDLIGEALQFTLPEFTLAPLLPPQSAVIVRPLAVNKRAWPSFCH